MPYTQITSNHPKVKKLRTVGQPELHLFLFVKNVYTGEFPMRLNNLYKTLVFGKMGKLEKYTHHTHHIHIFLYTRISTQKTYWHVVSTFYFIAVLCIAHQMMYSHDANIYTHKYWCSHNLLLNPLTIIIKKIYF